MPALRPPRPRPATRSLLRVLGLTSVAFGLAAAPARAEPTQAELARARQLFGEATAAEADQRWSVAIEKLRTALGVKETPGLRYHLGYCLEETGELLGALVEYARARTLIGAGAPAPDVEPLVGPALERVAARIPTLTVELPPGVAIARVEVDGAELAPGKPERLAPGAHELKVTAPGRPPFTKTLALAERERAIVRAELPPDPVSPAPPRSPAPAARGAAEEDPIRVDTEGFGARDLALVGGATLTIVGLVGGVYFLSRAATAGDDAERASAGIDAVSASGSGDECSSPSFSRRDLCDELARGLDARDTAHTWATVSLVGAGVGALATAGTWLLWDSLGEAGASRARAPRLAPAAARAPGGWWLGARGAF